MRPHELTSPARRHDAAAPVGTFHGRHVHGLWHDASKIRREWQDHGLSTQPADRRTAERSLTAIYAKISRPQPRFTWVDSPAQAIPLVTGLPTLDQLSAWIRDPHPPGAPPLASDLAMVTGQLRGSLGAGLSHSDPELSAARTGKHREPWPELPPVQALDSGVPLGVVLHRGIRTALHRSLADGFRAPVRAALAGQQPVAACWYGQQEASWIAYYDIVHRLGLARYRPADLDHLGHWTALARSCGWWWPDEKVCVVVERPELARTEPVPGAWHDEVRLTRDGIRYRDGWQPLLAQPSQPPRKGCFVMPGVLPY